MQSGCPTQVGSVRWKRLQTDALNGSVLVFHCRLSVIADKMHSPSKWRVRAGSQFPFVLYPRISKTPTTST